MYGFIPNATTEKCDRPPPENRSSRPASALPSTKTFELILVHARDRHGGQQAEDDQQAEDIQDPAPDVRRPECIEERFEHGSGVVAGRLVGLVGRGRRIGVGLVGGGGGRAGVLGHGCLGGRPRGRVVCGARPRRAPRRRPGGRLGRLVRLGLRAACRRRPGRASRQASRRSPRCPSMRQPRRSTPRAASGVLGISSTLTLPPAASILARADAVNASATTNSGVGQLAGAEDLERLVQGPDEPDGAQDVLVDGDRAVLAAPCRPRARTRRPRRARRSRRCSRPRTRS